MLFCTVYLHFSCLALPFSLVDQTADHLMAASHKSLATRCPLSLGMHAFLLLRVLVTHLLSIPFYFSICTHFSLFWFCSPVSVLISNAFLPSCTASYPSDSIKHAGFTCLESGTPARKMQAEKVRNNKNIGNVVCQDTDWETSKY